MGRPETSPLSRSETSPLSRAGALPLSAKVMAVLLSLTGLLTVLYWVLYFFAGAVQVEASEVYVAFENAFPAADGWMALACFLSAAGLLGRRPWGLAFGLCAGSAMIFLGLMDVLFNIEQGLYAVRSLEMSLEILINIWTLGFGAFTIWFLWTRRKLFAD
ncbi:MAG: hypothetical protein K6U08_04300 [Firmicutes bacterium]|nr:hypothetical protein [Bacillota bacterium]